MARVIVLLWTVLVAWLGAMIPASATEIATSSPLATYTYVAPINDALDTGAVTERGPPGRGHVHTTHDAIDQWSHGASARPDGPTPSGAIAYDHCTVPVQGAQGTGSTREPVRVADEGAVDLVASGVAANTADNFASASNKIYSNRALQRMANEPGPHHNFPGSFDDAVFSQGPRTVVPNYFKVAKPNLRSDSIGYRLPGELNGRAGVYEIFTRPSVSGRTELIMHRFFRAF